MRFEDKRRAYAKEEVWEEYCGFLDLSLKDFMHIQHRLLQNSWICGKRVPWGKLS